MLNTTQKHIFPNFLTLQQAKTFICRQNYKGEILYNNISLISQWKFWSEIKLSLNTEKLLLQQNFAQEGVVYLLAKIYSSGPSNFHGS